jgi:uncharacterized protein (TIGR03437 family)
MSKSGIEQTRIVAVCIMTVMAVLSTEIARGQPLLFHRGAVNAASFAPPGTPGGAIAQGSIFTVFGRSIGPETPSQVSAFPLETQFQGVSIDVVQGNSHVSAIPLFVSAGQINAIMPSNAPIGEVSVRVTYNGDYSNPVPAFVARHNPGIFTATGGGIGPGIVQNFISQTEQPVNSPRQAASPGQVVILWATGLGPITGEDSAPPPVGNLPFGFEIFIGGVAATNITYSGRAPGIAGLDQLVFVIPPDAPLGCYVPLQVRAEGRAVSNSVTVALRAAGSTGPECVDDANPFASSLISGGVVGALDLFRVSVESDVDVAAPVSFSLDRAGAYFRRELGGPFPFNPLLAVPPRGACTAYAFRGDILAGASPPFVPSGGLDAGSLSWNGPGGGPTLERGSAGPPDQYPVTVAAGGDGDPLYLTPGEYRLNGTGGTDVGPINSTVGVAKNLEWSNRGQFDETPRNAPLRVTWTGGGEGPVFVVGVSIDRPNDATALFLCSAAPGSSSFDVPEAILTNLPPSRATMGQSRGLLLVGAVPGMAELASQGLNFGAVLSGSVQAKTVRWVQ